MGLSAIKKLRLRPQVIFSNTDDEARVISELFERLPNLPDDQLLELKTIAIWSAMWLRRERQSERARRFLGLARACRDNLTVRCPEADELVKPPR